MSATRPTLGRVKACLQRELAMRKAVYPNSTKLNAVQKEEELAAMAEALRLVSLLHGISDRLRSSRFMQDIAETIAYAGPIPPSLQTALGITDQSQPAAVLDDTVARILAIIKDSGGD